MMGLRVKEKWQAERLMETLTSPLLASCNSVVAANSIKTSVLSPSQLWLLTLKPKQIESLQPPQAAKAVSASKFIITIKRSLIYVKILKRIFMMEINTFCCGSLNGPHKQRRISGLGL